MGGTHAHRRVTGAQGDHGTQVPPTRVGPNPRTFRLSDPGRVADAANRTATVVRSGLVDRPVTDTPPRGP